MAVRIVVVDGWRLVREALAAFLTTVPGFTVIGETDDVGLAVELARAEQPDVIVLDARLPRAAVLIKELRLASPGTRTLLTAEEALEEEAAVGFEAGALGYIGKRETTKTLVTALRAVSEGSRYVAPALDPRQLSRFQEIAAQRRSASPLALLSPREREVFSLLLRAFSNDGIAAQLKISRRTVETHRANLLKKLGVHSIPQLFVFTVKHGLMPEDVEAEAGRLDESRPPAAYYLIRAGPVSASVAPATPAN